MLKLMLKMFVQAGGLFGVAIALYVILISLEKNTEFLNALLGALIGGIILGGVFGVVMALILVPAHYYFFKKAIDPVFEPASFGVRQTCVVSVKSDFDSVFDFLIHFLIRTQGFTVKTIERETGLILVETSKSLKSFGEQLVLKIKSEAEVETKIEFSSQPLRKLTLTDYGKNYENIKLILKNMSCNFSIG